LEVCDDYLGATSAIYLITSAIRVDGTQDVGVQKFSTFSEMRKQELNKNFNAVRYFIDDSDTLALVTGGECIEKVQSIILIFINLLSLINVHLVVIYTPLPSPQSSL
jgi:hypothetical protein